MLGRVDNLNSNLSTKDKNRFSFELIVVSSLFFVGSILNYLAYSSIEPVITGLIFIALGTLCLLPFRAMGLYEIGVFQLTFAVNWITAGIAAIYANWWNDPFQVESDASTFYELSSSGHGGYDLEVLKSITEGSGAVYVWQKVYAFFDELGFENLHSIGISVNVMLVALTGVCAIKMAREVYGDDFYRLNRLLLLFCSCGMFWLFASVHLRDASILFSTTLLMLFWVRCLRRFTMMNLVFVVLSSGLAFVSMEYLRKEFLFMPLAMCFAGLSSLLFDATIKGWNRLFVYISLAIVSVPAIYIFLAIKMGLTDSLSGGYEGYSELSTESSDSGSLGSAFIVNAILPIRLILGSIYLFIFPIPCWIGFQVGTVYNLLKSCNVIYMYFVIPLLIVAILRIVKNKNYRTAPILFLLFTFIGFTLAIAGTSLETRHFGVFLVPILILSLIPDFRVAADRLSCKITGGIFAAIMVLLHLAWAAVKLV
jgi:hypothetical protein